MCFVGRADKVVDRLDRKSRRKVELPFLVMESLRGAGLGERTRDWRGYDHSEGLLDTCDVQGLQCRREAWAREINLGVTNEWLVMKL